MKKHIKIIVKTIIFVFVIGCGFYFWKLAPVKVKTFEVKQSLIQQTIFGTGTLEAKIRLAVSPRATGTIHKLYADQGDIVKAGTLLAEMDSEDIVQQMKVAEAELAVANASLQRINAEIHSAKANLEYADAMFQRSKKLLSSNAEPRSTFDKNRQNMLVAAAALEQAEKKRIESETALVKYQSQIAYYKIKLAETRLAAPFDALIIRRNREQGAVVNPGVSIMDIVDTSSVWASVWVDETAIAMLRNGLASDVIFRTLPQQRFPGKICRLWRETDRETREYKVDIALEKLPPNWTLGQRLEVFIKVSQPKKCINIPANLISWKNNNPFVLLVVDGRITEQPVKLGIRTQNSAEIISGLSEKDKIVMQPQKNMAYINRRIKK
ncbi:MAG: efflux RND transporter periplasmic adaptor subunit [Lentisphaeria bacterium]|nr:efflux RND transporter periplasmic adaptor subunit [Lentisphaeria bacterium]